ncbi:MAG: peptide chain release factor N(5)-glutamine methyltransferase, partial [Firmicutes bacterium]|nr:peptide chain release factor N(5)-glutamine methyltransferase [Bacillota bacterium]
MTILEAQRKTAQILKGGGVENAMKEARFLMEDALGMDNVQLVTSYRDFACGSCVETAFGWAERRAAGEPLQYILGHTDFMGLDMKVAPGVLIPRPETEGLCELLAEEAKKRAAETGKAWPGRILDLCTGSGCIAAWAGHAFPGASVVAADLSEEALAVAKENCRAHESFPGQIGLLQGDLFDALGGDGPRFDVILSNPPYVPSGTVDTLEREVKDFEPRLALDGGPEGMDIVSRIIEQGPGHLADGGLLLMEIDDTQEELVLDACAKTQRYVSYAILRDLAGKVRYLKAS